jgi:hypothetical protein
MLASSGVLFAFFKLQYEQQVTKLTQLFFPPRERGIIWSIVKFFSLPQ